MKQRGLLVFLVLVVAFGTVGCFDTCVTWGARDKIRGSGDVVTEDRPVSDITGVKLATIGTLHIQIGDKEEFYIEAEDNLLEYLETDVRRGILKITTSRNVNLKPREPIDYYLTVKELDRIEISSAGDVEAPDLQAKRFTIVVSSAGDLEMGALECARLDARLSSAGDVDIEELNAKSIEATISSAGDLIIGGGKVIEQDISLSSAGNYEAKNLESAEARVRVSSAGSATVQVSDYLDAATSSVGSIYYLGNPDVDQRVSSLGRIKRVGKGSRRNSSI